MGRETAIDALSQEHKKLLDDKLFENGFNGYVDLACWLQSLGYQISKSSLHRYGQKLEHKLAAVKASTQAAMMIAESVPDDEDARSQAVLSLVQTELFNALVELQEATSEKTDPADRIAMLAKAGKGIADIVKASVMQKKHSIDVKEKAVIAANEVANIVKSNGLSDKTADLIRAKILGVAE